VLGDGDVGFFAEIDGGLVNRQLLDGGPEVEVVALVFAGEAVVEFFGEMDREGSRGLGAAVRQCGSGQGPRSFGPLRVVARKPICSRTSSIPIRERTAW
jgi:hypothetical protein